MEHRPTIIMTAGDPWSVTTEAWARLVFDADAPFRALARESATLLTARLVVCGSAVLIRRQLDRLGSKLPPQIELIDDGIPCAEGLYPADPAARGAHAIAALDAALKITADIARTTPAGSVAVVTGPIDKKSCALAGFPHPGQTEFFEAAWGSSGRPNNRPTSPSDNRPESPSALMLLAGPRLRVGLATRHIALKDVSAAITPDLVASQTAILAATMRQTFGIPRPRIAVCGLNPHAGDRGLFGDEEAKAIAPGIAAARNLPACFDALVSGPHSADTIFHEAWAGQYDAVLAMYHDQGLAPLKALHFHEAVNISAGLPHLRVSPDHGPASGLFLTGRADLGSFRAAIRVACSHLNLAVEA